jgi:hypothetical protein
LKENENLQCSQPQAKEETGTLRKQLRETEEKVNKHRGRS